MSSKSDDMHDIPLQGDMMSELVSVVNLTQAYSHPQLKICIDQTDLLASLKGIF